MAPLSAIMSFINPWMVSFMFVMNSDDPDVESTNNHAKRALRTAMIARKNSGDQDQREVLRYRQRFDPHSTHRNCGKRTS